MTVKKLITAWFSMELFFITLVFGGMAHASHTHHLGHVEKAFGAVHGVVPPFRD